MDKSDEEIQHTQCYDEEEIERKIGSDGDSDARAVELELEL